MQKVKVKVKMMNQYSAKVYHCLSTCFFKMMNQYSAANNKTDLSKLIFKKNAQDPTKAKKEIPN